jgi:hypothetical protein
VKYFLIYSAARLGLFAACFAVVGGIGVILSDDEGQIILWALIIGGAVSFVLSWKLLEGPRERLALSVQERAERARIRFEEMKTAEDDEAGSTSQP